MERKCTNLSSLFFCCGFVVVLFILVGYSATKTDIDRLTKGFDDCGNVCGKKNKNLNINTCTYMDMTSKPKVEVLIEPYSEEISLIKYSCVENCKENYVEVFNRCFKSNNETDALKAVTGFLTEASQDLIKTWPKIILTCFVALVFSYIILILFRYAVEYVIYIVYLSFVGLIAAGAIACAVGLVHAEKEDDRIGFLVGIIVCSGVAFAFFMVLWCFRFRIKLTAQLFKETSNALIDIPAILFEPILSFISLILAFVPFLFFLIVFEAAGDPTQTYQADGSLQVSFDEESVGVTIARYTNIVAFIWFVQFIFGCQHFVIGGTISKWYFTRDKKKLDSPILTTFNHLIRFHLGSVCLGSIFITIVKILNTLTNFLRDLKGNPILVAIAACIAWILSMIEEMLKYLIRNAYIIVAKDGTPLVDSGRKAFKLIWENLKDVASLNIFGDIALVFARLFVFGISTFIAYELMKSPEVNHVWVPIVLSGIFAFLIAHCLISVFEMTVDTIFICFCDDITENDGSNERPYFMSPKLYEVMRKLKMETGGDFNLGGTYGNPQDPESQPMYPALPKE